MVSNEFRLGNFVYRMNRSTEVHLPINDPLQIVSIGLFDIEVIRLGGIPAKCDNSIKLSYFDSCPIEITDEWLLKFGFEKGENNKSYTCKDESGRFIDIDLINNGIKVFIGGYDSVTSSQCFSIDNIKYVHQIQNLLSGLQLQNELS